MAEYRTVQEIRDTMADLEQTLRDGLLADSTRVMSEKATEAMAIVDGMLQALRDGASVGGGDRQDHSTENLLKAAERALTFAWNRGEKVALGTSTEDMRARILDFKTYADFANAYVSAALGTEL
jgi:CO dehydrogenase/acetyl-CoA synthase delta subunit